MKEKKGKQPIMEFGHQAKPQKQNIEKGHQARPSSIKPSEANPPSGGSNVKPAQGKK